MTPPHSNAFAGETVYVVDGARTPFLRARGRPGPFSASDLAVTASQQLLARQPIEAQDLSEVVIGSAMPSEKEANIGRVVGLRIGTGHKVPAWTVMRNCASAMQALDSAAKDIALGRADLVLAGGTEAMSRAPLIYNEGMVNFLADLAQAKSIPAKLKALMGFRPGHLKPVISLIHGLTDPVVGLNMGQTCEIIAHHFGISREQMDEYAVRSHLRLANAFDEGLMHEVEPLYMPDGAALLEDDGLRRNSSTEKLAKLKAVFDRRVGLVTAGNSSQITDGACMLLLASEKAVEQHDLKPLGAIKDAHWAALDPAQMGLGPVHASVPLMAKHHLSLDDIDYWEINEAFAGQVLACSAAFADEEYCRRELGLAAAVGQLDQESLNVDGGAISLGHPVGASGARIVLHLLHVLRRTETKRGIATLCIGGGQGGAMLLESETN